MYRALTGLRQELDGLQHTLSVDSRLVVLHLSVNDVNHTSCSAPDSSSSSVESVHVALLQSNYTFVDIFEDVVLFGGAKKKDSKWRWRDPRLSLARRNNVLLQNNVFLVNGMF